MTEVLEKFTDTYKVCEHVTLTRQLKKVKYPLGEIGVNTTGILLGGVSVWGCGDCESPWFTCEICGKEATYYHLAT